MSAINLESIKNKSSDYRKNWIPYNEWKKTPEGKRFCKDYKNKNYNTRGNNFIRWF